MKNRFDSQRNPSGGICGAKNFPGAFDRIYEDNGVLIMTETATLTWFSGNYGSTMQAFALQKTVMELGYGNRIINYVPNKREKLAFFCKSSARFVTLKAKIENKKIESKFLNRDEIDLKNRKFEEFYENSFFLTEMIPVQNQMKSLNNKYRIFLCGSDQIWNPNYFKKCNFLDFVSESNKKIAYAPSIGTTQLTENEKRKMKSYLDRFDKISVREESSKRLIESVVDKPVQVVCDPVFLLSREKWIEKMQLKEPEEKYILCYFLGNNPEYQKMTEKLQESLKIKVKIIPTNTFGYALGFETQKTVGPKDWLSLLYGAEFVLTDSFHATAFSIIFNKSFYVLKRFSDTSPKSQNSRIYHLLNMTGLEDRIWQNTTNVSYIENDIWKTVDEKMRTERETSTLWLKNALEDK